MATANILNCEGKSGKTYSFKTYSLKESFNNVECVYIYTKFTNDSWDTLYVGQTDQLSNRIYQHATGKVEDSDLRIQESGATHIHIFQLNSKPERLAVEKDLLDNPDYYWTCNDPKTQQWKRK